MRMSLLILFFLYNVVGYAQTARDTITAAGLRATLEYLASDSMRGRGNYTPQLEEAAHYIAQRFERAGLDTLDGGIGYFFPFAYRTQAAAANGLPPHDQGLMNVVGILPGRSRPQEFVMFSAHYDHVGMHESQAYNGANDNASGTAALLALAEYFALRGDNERTILFCAFAGEELGLLGSKYFVNLFEGAEIVAAINIEMIGVTTVGNKAFFITGAHLSDIRKIFSQNLGKSVKIRKEPGYEKMLFQRSDNLPFAMKGIPAHTIMASDDDDPCYHQPCDDVKALNIDNMAFLVRAIASASATIISGRHTPRRISPDRIGIY